MSSWRIPIFRKLLCLFYCRFRIHGLSNNWTNSPYNLTSGQIKRDGRFSLRKNLWTNSQVLLTRRSFDLYLIKCSDIISPCQKMPSEVFPLVLPSLTYLWAFFQNCKNEKNVYYPCNIFESSLMIKKIEVVLKICKKHVFISSLF